MGETPEELREELAEKREDLSRDLEAIGDRVSPGRMVERRQAAVRSRVTDMRDRVMGAKDTATEHMYGGVSSTTSSVSDTMSRVGDATRSRAEGNPLAVGMVAFGAGLVAATLFPATRREQQLAAQAQPKLEEAASKVGPAARELAEEVKPAAQEAMADLREDAKSAAENVKQQASDAASETKQTAKSAAKSGT